MMGNFQMLADIDQRLVYIGISNVGRQENMKTVEARDECYTDIFSSPPPIKRYTVTSHCSSPECAKTAMVTGVIKNVRKHVDECPDCGYALFHMRKEI